MKCGRFETFSFAICYQDKLPLSGTKEGFGADADDMTVYASSIPILNHEMAWIEGGTNIQLQQRLLDPKRWSR